MDGADDLEQLEELYYSDSHQASRIGTILNLANGMCGVGVLAVPLLVQMMSLPLSLVLIVALHLTTGFTARLTVALAEKSGARSLESIARTSRAATSRGVLQLAFAIGSMVINVMACRERLVPLVRRAAARARRRRPLAAAAAAARRERERVPDGPRARRARARRALVPRPRGREQRVAAHRARGRCPRARGGGRPVLTTAVSLLCLAAIFGVVLADGSARRALGSRGTTSAAASTAR